MKKPICWTIAGSDSGGGAGIQADLASFQSFGVHGCCVITAITAQNSYQVGRIAYTSAEVVKAQLTSLAQDLPAKALKIGVLGSKAIIKTVATFLKQYPGKVICDPVMIATCGDHLYKPQATTAFIDLILPYVTVLTPNRMEAETLTGLKITQHSPQRVARRLLSYGSKSILLKDAGEDEGYCQDYWTDGQSSFWLTQSRLAQENTHGSGCTLSAALTANLAKGLSLADALVLAKLYVTRGIRTAHRYGRGPGPINHTDGPHTSADLPWLTDRVLTARGQRLSFPACDQQQLGFYPILPSVAWLERLLPSGVKTVQLRLKDKQGPDLEQAIKTAVALAKRYQVNLFINDHWELAIKYKAYGVHLGQEDLQTANCEAIAQAGLRLGVSTHTFAELARAHALQPSYIALGPIYETTSKPMACPPQGLERLKLWRKLVACPLVAIGGIDLNRLPAVWQTGVDAVAVISAITQADNPIASVRAFMRRVN